MTLDYDEIQRRFPTLVGIQVYPERLGRVLEKLQKPDTDPQQQIAGVLGKLVAHGLRARIRSANLLTGQLYVSIEYVPNAPPLAFDESARPLTLPTVSGDFERMQEQLAGIVARIDKVPFDSIGKNLDSIVGRIDKLPFETLAGNLDAALTDLDRTLKQADGQLLPETAKTLRDAQRALGAVEGLLAEDAPLQHELIQTLREAQRAARSLRVLADLLERHPESLLRGRPGVPPPAPDMSRKPSP
jgi:paraquat-inducible protein B